MNSFNKIYDVNFIQQLPNAISIVDKNMCYLCASDKWIEKYGLAGTEIMGKCHYDIFPEIGEEWKKIHQRCLQGESIKNEEDKFIRANGNTQWLRWEVKPYKDSSNEIIGMIMFSEDITIRKKVDEIHKEINVSSGIGGWDYNLIDDNLYWTSVTKNIYEVNDDYLPDLKKAIQFYKRPEEREKEITQINTAIENGKSWKNEIQIVTAKGNERWIKYSGQTEFVKGKCIRIYGTCQDVTEKRNLIEALHKSEAQFRGAFENSAIGMALVTPQGKILEANQSLCNSIGYTKKELYRKTVQEITHPDDLEQNLNLLQNLLSGKSKSYSMEKRFFHKKGNIIWAVISISLVRDDRGNPSHLVSQIEDITEKKKAEEEVKLLNEKILFQNAALESSNQELQQFAYVASHDLQEPVRMVKSFMELIKQKYQGQLDEKAQKYISFAVEGATRMEILIRDLLEYSISGTEHDLGKINLNEVLEEIKGNLRMMIKEKSASITVSHLPTLKVSQTGIRQVMQNLIGNALKYTDPKRTPEIEITASEQVHDWKICVSDNGIGISKNYFDKIFVLFNRLHAKTEYSGTGIGLTICKKIISKIGGEIWVESEKGIGSSFYFTIPK